MFGTAPSGRGVYSFGPAGKGVYGYADEGVGVAAGAGATGTALRVNGKARFVAD